MRIFVLVFIAMFGSLFAEQPKYLPVFPTSLHLPAFHKPHFGYQTEWWYYTGFLTDSTTGFVYGVQFTLFKSELSPGIKDERDIRILSLQHLAVTDIHRGKFYGKAEAVRNVPGLSMWRQNNAGLVFSGQGASLKTKYILRNKHHSIWVSSPNLHLQAELTTNSEPLFHGKAGYSTKTHAGTASWYVSQPDVSGFAEMQLGESRIKGSLQMWMDHEVSSRFLGDQASGWDWIHFTMSDGKRLSGFRVRGERDYNYAREILPSGTTDIDLTWQVIRTAKSSSGTLYPVEWILRSGRRFWKIEAIVKDCEMPGYLPYWEGPVVVTDQDGNTGKGYLEMTGYSKKFPMKM